MPRSPAPYLSVPTPAPVFAFEPPGVVVAFGPPPQADSTAPNSPAAPVVPSAFRKRPRDEASPASSSSALGRAGSWVGAVSMGPWIESDRADGRCSGLQAAGTQPGADGGADLGSGALERQRMTGV